jgi:hypothetical protein
MGFLMHTPPPLPMTTVEQEGGDVLPVHTNAFWADEAR